MKYLEPTSDPRIFQSEWAKAAGQLVWTKQFAAVAYDRLVFISAVRGHSWHVAPCRSELKPEVVPLTDIADNSEEKFKAMQKYLDENP